MKKIIALLLALCLCLSLAACTDGGTENTPAPTNNTDSTAAPADPTVSTVETTAPAEPNPSVSPSVPTDPIVPSEPPVTDPSEPAPSIPDATAPSVTEPTDVPAPTEPSVKPTEPDATTPRPTTKPTEPAITIPHETQSRPTTPTITEPPAAIPPSTAPTSHKPVQCSHSYTLTDTQAATCTSAKIETYICSKCGDSYQEAVGSPAHSYVDATCTQPKTCSQCGATSGSALGHSFNTRGICIRCGEPETGAVEITVSVRDTKGNKLANVTVTIYLGSLDTPAGTVVTGSDGLAHITLDHLETYHVVLSDLPANVTANSSYTFSTKQANINLATQPVLNPMDHSQADYAVGSTMADFTLSDTDGNVYNLYELLEEKDLVILDFWYCTCAPCKKEFPYFEEALDRYGDDIELLAVNPLDSLDSIVALREELGSTFPMLRDTVNLYRGFDVTAYPVTVFIDSDGKVLSIHRGAYSSQDAFLNDIETYLK